ncbi:MAG: hypothetical protein M0R33_11475 [Methylomonas sp.]|uniref:hypothetical protein n=1 Tax=Methylomonas sp. TaxID=418 RepID=UPI0025E719A4|nr:hypothetical protein [Methylomonas sp.]MCK9607054.1 hypothetical protein [Methylomonas sp.]
MSLVRVAYFMGLIICLPLFIRTWGVLFNAETPINAALVIGEAVKLSWLLQAVALLISAPWFIRDFAIKQALIAHLMLIMAPVPFFVVAWLADAITLMMMLKLVASLVMVSLFCVFMILPFNRLWFFKYMPINLDMPLCLMAAVFIWKTSDLWLRWLT